MTTRLAYVTTVPDTQWEFLRGQNAYLTQHGFELHSIASPGDRLADLATRDGTTPHAVPISRTISPIADFSSLIRLYRLFRRIKPDMIHVSTSKAAVLGAISGWLAGVPLRVFLIRGLASEDASGAKRAAFRACERLAVRLCHASICVAPSLLSYAREQHILGPAEGSVMANGMSNGVDPVRFNPQSTQPVDLSRWLDPEITTDNRTTIGYVGRIALKKGLAEIVEMWKVIREAYPETLLLLVGPWESVDDRVRSLRQTLQADPRVVMPGRVDDITAYYRAMDIFVMPTHGTEGFPNAPMQAACVGLPVIASRVVGCVDAVRDGLTGKLIPPRDAEALTEAVRFYLTHVDQRVEHGRRGRERVLQDFAPEPIWEALLEEYRRLLSEREIAGSRN